MLQLFIWSTPDTLVEARELLKDLIDMSIAVQYPDSRRGLYKSRTEVNNYFKRFIAVCFSYSQVKGDDWAKLGLKAETEKTKLIKVKDVVASLDSIY